MPDLRPIGTEFEQVYEPHPYRPGSSQIKRLTIRWKVVAHDECLPFAGSEHVEILERVVEVGRIEQPCTGVTVDDAGHPRYVFEAIGPGRAATGG